jgi:hypothetical protein
VSAETGEVLVSDEISLNSKDELYYATYNGDAKQVYPGFWKSPKVNSPEDVVSSSYSEFSNLQRLFSAKRTIKSAEQLMGELVEQIVLKSSGEVIRYNPENK